MKHMVTGQLADNVNWYSRICAEKGR